MTSEEALSHALGKVRLQLAKLRVRIRDNFQDFDKLHAGVVTIPQFKRCLTIALILPELSEADVDALITTFRHPRRTEMVDYAAFLSVVEQVELKANVTLDVYVAQLSLEDQSRIELVMKTYVHRILTTGVDVRLAFREFDKQNSGLVTRGQFERAFPFKVDQKLLLAVIAKYQIPNGTDVAYAAFCNDVRAAVEAERLRQNGGVPPTVGNPRSPQRQGESYAESMSRRDHVAGTHGVDCDAFVAELRCQIHVNRLSIAELFRDADKNNTGHLSIGAFSSGLGRIKLVRLPLTQSNVDALVERYAVYDTTGEKRVDYLRFLADSDPLLHPEHISTVSTADVRVNTLSPVEERQLEAVLDKVRTSVRTRRVNIRPTFQDFDRSSKGIYQTRSCTRTRFERALAINKINLALSEVELLERKYKITMPGEADSDAINYVAFCAAVDFNTMPLSPDDAAQGVAGAGATLSHTRGSTASGGSGDGGATAVSGAVSAAADTPADVEGTLGLVARQCYLRAARLAEFFRDFDPLHSGHVPADKFTCALSISNIRLSQSAIDALTLAFAQEGKVGHVNYVAFVAAVAARVDGIASSSVASPVYAARTITDLRVRSILQRIAETVRGRQILLPPFFLDYDRHHCGRITKGQFVQTLTRHRFPISSEDAQLLCAVFAHPDDATTVQYRPFIAAVDESEDVGVQSALRKATRGPGRHEASAGFIAPETAAPLTLDGGASSAGVGGGSSAELCQAALGKVVALLSRGVRVSEFFRDSDPLRRGVVHKSKFSSCLDMIGAHLPTAEMEAIAAQYSSDTIADHVDYQIFCADVTAHASLFHQHAPSPGSIGAKGHAALSESRIRTAFVRDPLTNKLLTRVKKQVEARRLQTLTLFRDHDPLRKGRVTEPQFFAVLSSIGIKFSPLETEAVTTAIRCGPSEVQYKDFCNIVDYTQE